MSRTKLLLGIVWVSGLAIFVLSIIVGTLTSLGGWGLNYLLWFAGFLAVIGLLNKGKAS